MQTSNRLFDDLAKVANGAASTLVGLKSEIETLVRQQLQRLLADMDLVSRDEFEAVKAMAAKARTEQERLEARLAELEGGKPAPKSKTTRAKPKPKNTK